MEEQEQEHRESSSSSAAAAEAKQVVKVLEALKEASKQLQSNPNSSSSAALKALLQLRTESDPSSILSADPHLSTLSHHLTRLRNLIRSSQDSAPGKHASLRAFILQRARSHEISRLATAIEAEIQAWIDREDIVVLVATLNEVRQRQSKSLVSGNDDHELIITKLERFIDRLSRGFDIDLQNILLKSGILADLEWVLCQSNSSKRLREKAACAITQVVLFNKDVFVGQVLMGGTIGALISLGTGTSLHALRSLIRAIRSPLVDEIENSGGILKIVNYLGHEDLGVKIVAHDCVLEIGYFGRKEAIEAMLNVGLVKRLVELQRSELGGDLIELEKCVNEGVNVGGCEKKKSGGGGRWGRRSSMEMRYLERHPFASCVARFTVQLEVGEGLRQREKRAFKQEILKRVKEACVSDAEAATIMAEVLWGSSP